MTGDTSLKQYLDIWAASDSDRVALSRTVMRIAAAAAVLTKTIARCSLTRLSGKVTGEKTDFAAGNSLDMRAHQLFGDALMSAPIAVFTSAESDEEIRVDSSASLGVAIDPLNGSSNIDTNAPVGTLFSIFSLDRAESPVAEQSILGCDGNRQLAAGFILFGPQTALVLTFLTGTHIFVLDSHWSRFSLARENVQIREAQREYSINASNQRFWDKATRAYISDCVEGKSGPRGEDFTMHWMNSLVSEAYRILVRGGIFISPRESRPGCENGLVRLLYEAFPVALLVEQAGGAATDGERRILDMETTEIDGRVPFVFGSHDKVARVARYHASPPAEVSRFPLFGQRKLLRTQE